MSSLFFMELMLHNEARRFEQSLARCETISLCAKAAGILRVVNLSAIRALTFGAVLAAHPAPAASRAEPLAQLEEAAKPTAEGIQDNSFLIEEAYNQEPGMVQHILNIVHSANRHAGASSDEWTFVFTQEWPLFSQAHQLSYTVPFTFLDEQGRSTSGFGDVLLNYRYQALTETKTRPAFAPRLSLILPTGDADEGFGDDTVGYQLNLPLSKVLNDRWTVHGNAGATLLPDVERHDLLNYNLGASVIYAVSSDFNLMLESVVNWDEEVRENGGTRRDAAVVLSPGLRYAFNHPNDAQTVIGLAVPIGLTSAAPDFGVFLYASFEHFFFRPKAGGDGK